MVAKLVKHPLFLPIFIGFIARVIYVWISNHIYYPDELFQSLEQAFRLVNGYGIIPWDIAYGLRSYVFPLFLAIPLTLAKILSVTDPALYHYFPQVFLALLSLSPIVAVYLLIHHFTKNRHAAQFAALIIAIWYELIYFSSRALTEMIAIDLFSFAVIALIGKRPKLITGSWHLIAATLFRPQLFLVSSIGGYALLKKIPQRRRLIIGGSLAVIIFGLIDQVFLGQFLGHLSNNIHISYASGISELFGSKPWWYYLVSLTTSSLGLWLVALPLSKTKGENVLWYSLVSTILLHSLILHKEYRFILITIPLWIMLLTLKLNQFIHHQPAQKKHQYWTIATCVITLISIAGICNKLPYQSIAYGQPLLLSDPNISVHYQLYHDPSACGIYDASRNWVYSPGYYALNRRIPLYSADYPPKSADEVSHYITQDNTLIIVGFTKQFSTPTYTIYNAGKPVVMPGYTVYKKDSPTCVPDDTYSSYRSFPAIDSALKIISAKAIIHK